VQLRRPIDLPEIALSDFVDFAIEDKEKHQAAGLMHLATGLREKATLQWNKTTAGKDGEKQAMTPALIGLEIDFSRSDGGQGKGFGTRQKGEGTLFAAPDEHGALQRLRVKRMGDGVLEISLRNTGNDQGSGSGSGESWLSSKALVLGRKGSPYVWPFRSASPDTVTSYEHLLRELLSRQIFSSSAAKTKAQENKKDGASVAPELPLKLHRSSSTAVFLMKMELAVMRKPIQASTPRINEEESKKMKKGKGNDPPTPAQLLKMNGQIDSSRDSPRREVYSTVVKIEGSAREGLRFSPVGPLQLVERSSENSVSFDFPAALSQVAGEFGIGGLSNASSVVQSKIEL
jgi:hypothetical protein